jgi:hypothetical protein
LLSGHHPEVPVEWPEPFPLSGLLCPVRDWPYTSYLVFYPGRDEALADLARWHDGVALVRSLTESQAPKVREAAVAVLAGDRTAVKRLQKALRRAGDPRFAEVLAV